MSAERLLLPIQSESARTTSARQQILHSLRDAEYRQIFVSERVKASVALQIRALRQQREGMTQAKLGAAIGMAQTWVSKLEDPEYGKMTVATLLRLAAAFDVDLEIKFRPFSDALDTLPTQGPDYFVVPSFADEFEVETLGAEDMVKVQRIDQSVNRRPSSAYDSIEPSELTAPRKGAAKALLSREETNANSQSAIGKVDMALRYAGA